MKVLRVPILPGAFITTKYRQVSNFRDYDLSDLRLGFKGTLKSGMFDIRRKGEMCSEQITGIEGSVLDSGQVKCGH